MTSLATLLTLVGLAAADRRARAFRRRRGGRHRAAWSVDLATLRAFLRRRIRTTGLVTASVAAAVHAGSLSVARRRSRNRCPHTGSRRAAGVARTGTRPATAGAPRLAGRGLGRARRHTPPRGRGRRGGCGQRPDTRADRAVGRLHDDDRFGDGRAAAARPRSRRRRGADLRAVGAVRRRPPPRPPRNWPTCPTRCSTCWPSGTASASVPCSSPERALEAFHATAFPRRRAPRPHRPAQAAPRAGGAAAHRHRRPRRLGQDRAGRRAVQATARRVVAGGADQRHLHHRGRRLPAPPRRAARRADRRGADRRLPAHRDPRRHHRQPRRHRRPDRGATTDSI